MPDSDSDSDKTQAAGERSTQEGFVPEDTVVFDPDAFCQRFVARESGVDKYIMQEKVGEGGMGTIIKVYDKDLKRHTVLKVMKPKLLENEHLFRLFIEEARITGRLEHSNIVPVHDFGVINENQMYFSMKFVHGESLGDILKKLVDKDPEYTERYSLFALLMIFRKVCDAMAFAHSMEIIHRDIKPDNIMIGQYGEVLLMDWGLARNEKYDGGEEPGEEDGPPLDENDDAASAALKTKFGLVKGTPAYMAPEQALGVPDQIDRRCDIFLLGSTLYTLAALRTPYHGKDIYEVLDLAAHTSYTHPGKVAPDREIPDELSRIIMKAMTREPEGRYQHVDDMSADIDALLEGRTVSTRKNFRAGDILMREGDTGTEAYVIMSGSVQVTKRMGHRAVNLVDLSVGDTVGEMAMIAAAPRSATVRAIEDTEVVVITSDVMRQGLSKLPPWMGNAVEALAQRLRLTNADVHPLSRADIAPHVLQQLRMMYMSFGSSLYAKAVGGYALGLSRETAIAEVASNLSVSRERVTAIIDSVLSTGLLTSIGTTFIAVPSFNLFCKFVDYLRQEQGIVTESAWKEVTTVFAAEGDIIVRHTLEENQEWTDEIAAVADQPEKTVLFFDGDYDEAEAFAAIHNALQEVQAPQDDLTDDYNTHST